MAQESGVAQGVVLSRRKINQSGQDSHVEQFDQRNEISRIGEAVQPDTVRGQQTPDLDAFLLGTLASRDGISKQESFADGLGALRGVAQLTQSFKELEWSDRERFDRALRCYPQVTSELTFVNLYAWASIQYPRWGEFEGHILVSYDPGNTSESSVFLPPIGPDPVGTMVTLCRQYGASFVRVPEELLHKLPEDIPWSFSEKDHDYLYQPEQIKALAGAPASELRRRLNKFNKNHGENVVSVPLDERSLTDAKKVVSAWLEERLQACKSEDERAGKYEDTQACMRILNKWHELPALRGSVIYVRSEPVSLCVGELVLHPAAPQGALVSHFEKSVLRKDLEGLPVYCFQVLCSELEQGCIVNRMQDAGVSGLKTWKQSWGPTALGKKATVGLCATPQQSN